MTRDKEIIIIIITIDDWKSLSSTGLCVFINKYQGGGDEGNNLVELLSRSPCL